MTDTKDHNAENAALSTAVRVELTGLTRPATFRRLPDALAALWESMRVLPLTAFDADCFRCFLLRPDAAVRTLEFLNRDGFLALSFALPDGSHTLRMSPARPIQVVGSERSEAPGATGWVDTARESPVEESQCRHAPYDADWYAPCAC